MGAVKARDVSGEGMMRWSLEKNDVEPHYANAILGSPDMGSRRGT